MAGSDPDLPADDSTAGPAAVDLYWLALGAGGHFVRLNGRIYEALAARRQRRTPCDLYHSALCVQVRERTFVIEQAPVRDRNGERRGVVAQGAVGSRLAGRFRIFRYEVRCWEGGEIPDVGEAVDSPRRLTTDWSRAGCVLDLVAAVPTPVWGRDELSTGEMWNSNSIIAWVIERCGLDPDSVQPPRGGRAPGWNAGLTVARGERCGGHRAEPSRKLGLNPRPPLTQGCGGRTVVPERGKTGSAPHGVPAFPAGPIRQ
jgi:hypothetical protein